MKSYSFFTDRIGYEKIETKDGEKYYVTGYISTKDLDKDGDIVSEECLNDMVSQLKSKKFY